MEVCNDTSGGEALQKQIMREDLDIHKVLKGKATL